MFSSIPDIMTLSDYFTLEQLTASDVALSIKGMYNVPMKVGDKYGRLTVTKWLVGKIRGHLYVEATCECGTTRRFLRSNLACGNTKSCGCLPNIGNRTHGMESTKEYRTWLNMHARCKYPSVQSYKYYGAKGVKVCKRWGSFENFHPVHSPYPNKSFQMNPISCVKVCKRWGSFENFYSDMGNVPDGKSIDRINPFGNYEPSNCRWATSLEQRHNRRNTYATLS